MLVDSYKTHLQELKQLATEYTEKMCSVIYSSIRLSDWETTEKDVLNLLWEGYEKNFKMTQKWLKENYAIESSLEPFISDFKSLSYHRDGIDIEERTKRKLADYQLNQFDPNIKIRIAREIGLQEQTGYKQFFFNLTKQTLVERFPINQIYVSIDNPDGYDDCGIHAPICEDHHNEIDHVCLANLQESDLPPYHPDCECFPVFEVIKE